MLKFIFRLAFLGLGLFVTYEFGKDALLPIWYRATGTCVEGRISGFLAGRNSPSVQREPDGVRKGKRRARRPVVMYPIAAGAADSLECRSSTGTFFTFSNYELDERVPVVFSKNDPAHAHIFGWQLIGMSLLVTLLGLFMLRMAVLGRA